MFLRSDDTAFILNGMMESYKLMEIDGIYGPNVIHSSVVMPVT
jgi:hypothetical protein